MTHKEIINDILKQASIRLDKTENKERGILMSTKYDLMCWCFISQTSNKKLCRCWKTKCYKEEKKEWKEIF